MPPKGNRKATSQELEVYAKYLLKTGAMFFTAVSEDDTITVHARTMSKTWISFPLLARDMKPADSKRFWEITVDQTTSYPPSDTCFVIYGM